MKNNKKKGLRAFTHSPVRAGIAMIAVLPALSLAAPWDFRVNADLGVIHTDNLFIAPAGAEESETVYTVAPEFTLASEGERIDARISYRPEAYFYSQVDDADEIYHVVDAIFDAALVRERLFLYLSGVHFQSIENPDFAIPTSNLPVSGNRVDSTVLEVRPYWQQRVGSASLRVEAGYRDIDYDGDQFQSSQAKDALFSLNNFQQQEGLAWSLDYSYRRMEYEISTPFEFQRAALGLGYWVTGGLRLFGTGGAETSFDDILEANLDDDFWEAGFEYRPNQRLNLEVAAGERSYGSSFRANFGYTLRRGSITLIYNETPSSRVETLFTVRPLQDTDNLDGFLDRPGNADRFVRKRGELQSTIELNKSNLSLRIFSEDRENRSTELGAPLTDETLSGVAVRWEWRFGAKTTLDVGADFAKREDDFIDDDLTRLNLGMTYRFSPRTSLRLEGIRAEQDGGAAAASYTENQGRLLIQLVLL